MIFIFILVFVAIWLGYKKGRAAGRNRFVWAAISGGAFLAGQILGEVIIGPSYLVFIPAFIVMGLALRYVDSKRDDDGYREPPPPPRFDNVE
ncbi:MAG: hypothetical protein JNL64_02150 [Blastocatellia bacterium]|nr:hypothetical protein [Blastocatellia bacterium]